MSAIADPTRVDDPDYVAGLREAVSASVAYGLAAMDARWNREILPPPPQLLTQARYAARRGVSLETVLRRYFAGYSVLGDFVVQAAEEVIAPSVALKRVLREEALLFDRLVAAVSSEYSQEAQGRARTVEERRFGQVKMLLDGELVDVDDLGYECDGWHIGLVIASTHPRVLAKQLAETLDRRLLTVSSEPGMAWAWLGGMRRLSAQDLLDAVDPSAWDGSVLAVGEPAYGLDGWRLTHREAKAALPIARLEPGRRAAYADVALVAAAFKDEVLAGSLSRLYLDPLSTERDGGVTLRTTLRAYFAAERNASSAAAQLRVSRKTVANRLRMVEERLGRTLGSCSAELEAALRLDKLPDRDILGP